MKKTLHHNINSLAYDLVTNKTPTLRCINETVRTAIPLFGRGDDVRVHEDSYVKLLVGMRSQLGAWRPPDSEPEEQWQWDKITALVTILYGAEAFE